MGSREMVLLALAIVSAFLFLSTTGATETAFDADSWDVVLVVGNGFDFFKNDTKIRKSTLADIRMITALAYDSVNRTLYISDVFDIRRGAVEENLDSELTFDRIVHTSNYIISSMVFDPVTKTLFWIHRQSLMKMEVASYGIDSSPKISKLLDLTYSLDLALDICHRFIYWTNNWRRSIERSRLDGTDREEIFTSDLPFAFYGLTVDHYGGKLYFGSSDRNTFKIEESNLDGTDRRVLVNSSVNNVPMPYCLAVDDTAVYWAGRTKKPTIWKVYKNGTAMRAIKDFSSPGYPHDQRSTILTRHSVEGIDCEAVLDKEQIRTPEQLPAESQVAARLEQISNKVDRLSTNQNQLLLALIGLLDDARLTHTAAISRIDALKPNLPNLLDKVPHPEN